jgi:N-acetylmuramoyl-L-alanine amidase
MLLLHYTGMRSVEAALDRLRDPVAEVSAHYLIDEDGTIFQLVAEARRAWHAGRGAWAGADDINDRSIGIELVNPGHEFGYRGFPGPQMAALEELCQGIMSRHPIPPHRVLGHSDVAPDRKEDPGELFDWARLARVGIGIWPRIEPVPDSFEAGPLEDLRRGLGRLGYGVAADGAMDAECRAVILAFQRHWLPDDMTGARDRKTTWRIKKLLDLFPAYP